LDLYIQHQLTIIIPIFLKLSSLNIYLYIKPKKNSPSCPSEQDHFLGSFNFDRCLVMDNNLTDDFVAGMKSLYF
jgi:hypothetical protein